MTNKWKVRKYCEGDEEKIFKLWTTMHPGIQDTFQDWMAWWNWFYKQNPVGNAILFLADDNDKIVGQYAIIPILMKIKNQKIIGSQGVHAMTHPNYRRQGIFQTLGKTTLSYGESKGINIMFAFANDFSRTGSTKKLNMTAFPSFHYFILPLNWENILKYKIKNKLLLKIFVKTGKILQQTIYRNRSKIPKGASIVQISSFDERINKFWIDISKFYPITIVKNRDYLNWRFVSIPNRKYNIYIAKVGDEIEGYIVLRCITQQTKKIGLIFDITAHPSRIDIIHLLISKAIEYFSNEKVDLIEYYIFNDKIYKQALRNAGFIRLPHCFTKFNFVVYSKLSKDKTDFLKDRKNWFIQIGDKDLF